MAISTFDLFKVGIGPSSSHTVGPMRAAWTFVHALSEATPASVIARVIVTLHGSLGATGKGHGSDKAVLLGLMGHQPDTVDVDATDKWVDDVHRTCQLRLASGLNIGFNPKTDLLFTRKPFAEHANGMTFQAFDAHGNELLSKRYLSVGGGFILNTASATDPSAQTRIAPSTTVLPIPIPITSADALLQHCNTHHMSMADVMRVNERYWRDDRSIDKGLDHIWHTMQACMQRGFTTEGTLPGPFGVKRRAAKLHRDLSIQPMEAQEPTHAMDWVNAFALAVSEENAAGGRVVTAPTNGAAGIIPATIAYYLKFTPAASPNGVRTFLLTASAIGMLYKRNASISGAEVGCQGEVGVACSMAAAGLCAILGGTPAQVENAAEIGMEHHLGLTCDPVGGLVQIPCIERNAMASVTAITAARLALRGTGEHHVSLDQVIKTMKETGADMKLKYKETARGGLALNIVAC
jgi:L-serine dehydratase